MRHVVPFGPDEPLHLCSDSCWCFPLEHEPGLLVHNAKDCREKLERQGLQMEGNQWARIWTEPIHPNDATDPLAPR